jgi:hypothetical protein
MQSKVPLSAMPNQVYAEDLHDSAQNCSGRTQFQVCAGQSNCDQIS